MLETWREQHLPPTAQQLEQMTETWDQLAEARKRQLEKQGKSTEDYAREVI